MATEHTPNSSSTKKIASPPESLVLHQPSPNHAVLPNLDALESLAADANPTSLSDGSKQRSRLRAQFLALCFSLFLAGWNDGTIGPLLPRIREVYQIGYTTASLVFMIACLGYCSGALLNVVLTDSVGLGKLLVLGCSLQAVAYTMQTPAPPLPIFLAAFGIGGMGLSIQDSQANGYVAAMENKTLMGILHAAYGVGAFCAPLVSTHFATQEKWSYHFLVSLAIAAANVVVQTWVFKFKHQDECLVEAGYQPGARGTEEQSNIRQMMSLKTVHLLAVFIFIYVGIEVTIGGWIVTYIIEERKGGPSAGYISSGFFGGLTLGRVLLLWVNEKVGEKNVIYLYTFLAIALELFIWLVPSLIGGAVAVSIVGLLLGPYFPIAVNHAGRVLPRWLLTASIGWIAGLGQAGTALLPFFTGALAGEWGIGILHPFVIAMMLLLAMVWGIVPNEAEGTIRLE